MLGAWGLGTAVLSLFLCFTRLPRRRDFRGSYKGYFGCGSVFVFLGREDLLGFSCDFSEINENSECMFLNKPMQPKRL